MVATIEYGFFLPGVCCWNVVWIATFLRKLLIFFEIQDGGRRHLGFWKKLHIYPLGSIKLSARCMLLKFGENRFILAKLLIFFEIQDNGRRHLIFWKICISALRGSIKVSARCVLLKFGENRFILAEATNIFRNSRWRPPPSWIFEIFIFRGIFMCILYFYANLRNGMTSFDA